LRGRIVVWYCRILSDSKVVIAQVAAKVKQAKRIAKVKLGLHLTKRPYMPNLFRDGAGSNNYKQSTIWL
jgi:hypothetical protein